MHRELLLKRDNLFLLNDFLHFDKDYSLTQIMPSVGEEIYLILFETTPKNESKTADSRQDVTFGKAKI